jgi:Ca2+-binding EF-hand superfamily protein
MRTHQGNLTKKICHTLLYGAAMLSACAILGSPAYSQETATTQEPSEQITNNPAYQQALKLFESFDLNKDGIVADYELSYLAKKEFQKKDINKDGKLTRLENSISMFEKERRLQGKRDEEGVREITQEDQREFDRWFNLVDTNKNDIITQYENLRFFRDKFKEFDLENKGKISKEEYLEYLNDIFSPKKKKK